MPKLDPLSTILLASVVLVTPSAIAADAPDQARPMVVVGPERFHKSLEPYLTYRSRQRPTHWASLESILMDSPGVDDPEKLKRWLFKPGRNNVFDMSF